MRNDETTATALFAVVFGTAVALAIASDIFGGVCAASMSASELVDKPFLGCTEFWIERYQSLIGGLLALAGAAVTIGVMRWQTNSGNRRLKKIALMRALAELRPFRFSCQDLANDAFYGTGESPNTARSFPKLRFLNEPDLLADLDEDLASQLMHFALIVERVRDEEKLIDVGEVHRSDYYLAFAAYFAEESFDLVNMLAANLSWAEDTDRPSSIYESVDNGLEIYPGVKKQLFW